MLGCFTVGGLWQSHELTIASYLPADSNTNLQLYPARTVCFGCEVQHFWVRRGSYHSYVRAIRHIWQFLWAWAERYRHEQKLILTYATNPLFIFPLMLLRRVCRFRMVTICSEVPQYRNDADMAESSQWGRRAKRWVMQQLNRVFDGYIFLTAQMNEICGAPGKLWMVMEGMADEIREEDLERILPYERRAKALLYAGGLHVENGIGALLRAFSGLPGDMELWLCGTGNCLDLIRSYAVQDRRIVYQGVIPNRQVIELEKSAILLVNPRRSQTPLARFAFPSKILEYFATGTPSVVTRLPGIPEEYYQHCYTFDDESVEGMRRTLRRVLDLPPQELLAKGRSAARFVQQYKAPMIQSRRIVEFLKAVASQ